METSLSRFTVYNVISMRGKTLNSYLWPIFQLLQLSGITYRQYIVRVATFIYCIDNNSDFLIVIETSHF